jgi:hypothetical protein
MTRNSRSWPLRGSRASSRISTSASRAETSSAGTSREILDALRTCNGQVDLLDAHVAGRLHRR